VPEERDPAIYPFGTVADVRNDLTFLVGIRRRVRLSGAGPTVSGPRGLALVGSRAFVAAYFSDNLSVVDLEPPQNNVVRTVALGPAPQMSVQRRGEMLFNDATLCLQHWQSCASCHPDARGDALNWDLLNDGMGNPKNSRSLLLVHKTPPSMSVGVFSTADGAVRRKLQRLLFAHRPEEDAVAILEYLKSLQPVPSPRLVGGKLSPAARRGEKLFFDANVGCVRCHPRPLFTDTLTHDVGSRGQYDRRDAFDTPTLIECWRTAPYLHDGRHTTMEELLTEGKHGVEGDVAGKLSEAQINDLAEYVRSL
jgi:cytochrome c peroxidase